MYIHWWGRSVGTCEPPTTEVALTPKFPFQDNSIVIFTVIGDLNSYGDSLANMTKIFNSANRKIEAISSVWNQNLGGGENMKS